MSKKHYVYPVASCKGCHLWLTKDNLITMYVQKNKCMKIERKYYCSFCNKRLSKEDFFEPYRSMMK